MFNLKSCLSNLITVQNLTRTRLESRCGQTRAFLSSLNEKIEIDDTSIHVKKKREKRCVEFYYRKERDSIPIFSRLDQLHRRPHFNDA